MNIFRVTISLLAFFITFAHGSYIPIEGDAPFNLANLPPRDRLLPLSSSLRSSLAASTAPPSPSTPPPPKLLSLLPVEENGVLLNGTVINPNPDNNKNATKSPRSCWTKPVKPTVPMRNGDFSPGQCQVCVTRWDTGADPMFQLWIRDAHNHAMGQMNATSWTADITNLTIPAGNKLFYLWEVDFPAMEGSPGFSSVYMTWQADADYFTGQMAFVPTSVGDPSFDHCSFSGSTENGAVTHFQCDFKCQP